MIIEIMLLVLLVVVLIVVTVVSYKLVKEMIEFDKEFNEYLERSKKIRDGFK